MTKLIILDRDGVINVDSPDFIKSPDEWIPIPGSLAAIAQLNQNGYTVTIATNQSGLSRELYSEATLTKIHEKMSKELAKFGGKIDSIFCCPHLPEDNCDCRKPKPGLMERIAKHYQVDLKKNQTPCVGDSLRDLLAANAAACRPILVLTGNGQKTKDTFPESLKNVEIFADLQSFVKVFLA
jgi:D-glycero-D-manno-heptose 1,7-bisphosphate phosphatase